MRVLITGAAGLIGGIVRADLAKDHELVLVDRRSAPGVLRKDLRWYVDDRRRIKRLLFWPSWWEREFTGTDVVVHLAANGNPRGSWRRVGRTNVQTTWNVLDAAARYGVPRVVFASSTWTVKGTERALAPACYRPEGPKIGPDAEPRPDAAYGVSKAIGELTGRAMVEDGRLHAFVAARIGWCPHPGQVSATSDDAALWVGARDLAGFLGRCVEADLTGFHVVYAISVQPESPYDLRSTQETLGWRPSESPPSFATVRTA